MVQGRSPLHFCFRRLQLSHARRQRSRAPGAVLARGIPIAPRRLLGSVDRSVVLDIGDHRNAEAIARLAVSEENLGGKAGQFPTWRLYESTSGAGVPPHFYAR